MGVAQTTIVCGGLLFGWSGIHLLADWILRTGVLTTSSTYRPLDFATTLGFSAHFMVGTIGILVGGALRDIEKRLDRIDDATKKSSES